MNSNELLMLLMKTIGLECDRDGYIEDQDLCVRIGYNGMLYRYNTSPNKFMHVPKHETYFNPLSNVRMMKDLFDLFIKKLEMEDISFAVIFESSTDDRKNIINVKDYQGNLISSTPYYNKILSYCDLIFRLSGTPYDLTEMDNREFIIK